MGYKEIRDEIIEAGSTLAGHSMNQERLKMLTQLELKAFGNPKSKSAKAEARHVKYMKNFARRQFERLLGNILNGTATPEDASYVARHFQDFQTTIYTSTSKKTEVSVFRFETQPRVEEI